MATKSKRELQHELQRHLMKLRSQLERQEELLLKAAIRAEEVHIAAVQAKALNETSKNAQRERKSRTLPVLEISDRKDLP